KFTTNTARVSNNVTTTGGTLDYSAGITGPVTFDAAARANQTTGIGGTWSGITTVTGSASAGDTVAGNATTYNGFNATTKGTFSAGGVAVRAFGNINDCGAA